MTAAMDEDEMPEIPALISVCALKDLLQLSSLQVVADLHFSDPLPLHHSDISVEDASSVVQWKREGHSEELNRMDATLKCA